MKGIIFAKFAEFVEVRFGLFQWQTALDEVLPDSEGAYVGTKRYPDEELRALIRVISRTQGLSPEEVECQFGEWVFPSLFAMAPESTKRVSSFKTYLSQVDKVIHVEVKKLYKDANTPEVVTQDLENTFRVFYTSPRHMCHFCEGLILGCAKHFGVSVTLSQSSCMKLGAKKCCIEVNT